MKFHESSFDRELSRVVASLKSAECRVVDAVQVGKMHKQDEGVSKLYSIITAVEAARHSVEALRKVVRE